MTPRTQELLAKWRIETVAAIAETSRELAAARAAVPVAEAADLEIKDRWNELRLTIDRAVDGGFISSWLRANVEAEKPTNLGCGPIAAKNEVERLEYRLKDFEDALHQIDAALDPKRHSKRVIMPQDPAAAIVYDDAALFEFRSPPGQLLGVAACEPSKEA